MCFTKTNIFVIDGILILVQKILLSISQILPKRVPAVEYKIRFTSGWLVIGIKQNKGV